MVTFISGVLCPTGPLHWSVKSRLCGLGPVVAEFDGWRSATALALYHLDAIGHSGVLIVTQRPRDFFRLPAGWDVQEHGLIEPRMRAQQSLWLGPPELAPLGAEALWPCFTDRSKPLPYRDKGPDLDPEYPDYSGLGPDHPLRY